MGLFVVVSTVTVLVILGLEMDECQGSTCKAYMGGKSAILGWEVHRYACCNNCNETDPYCDGTTWQGGSTEPYCGNCGRDALGGKLLSCFQCCDCDTQTKCAGRANGWNFRIGCWKWLSCFKSCCKKMAKKCGRNCHMDTTYCGDGVCQSNETPTNCPLDCCYQVNSTCVTDPTMCTPECCGEPSCCADIGISGQGSGAT